MGDRVARCRVVELSAEPLAVPLLEPFVIASARVDTTRAALLVARVSGPEGARVGLGEAACLHPVTREDMPDVVAPPAELAPALGRALERFEDAAAIAGDVAPDKPVLRAAVECALLDALARAAGAPLRRLLADRDPDDALTSDITLPIASLEEIPGLARRWLGRGFTCFKVKVGKDVDHDLRAILAVHAIAPGASYRLDANAGFDAKDALHLLAELARRGARVECFEQPCARDDLEGMAKVAREGGAPVIADESLRSPDDLARLHREGAAHGVNLKIVKLGGALAALELGRAARARGMQVMVGGMVETRLGMTAAAGVASALGGVEYCDLDTAFLLAEDPFEGGYDADGPVLRLSSEPGWGVARR